MTYLKFPPFLADSRLVTLLFTIIFFSSGPSSLAQDDYFELDVELTVPRLGNLEIPVLIWEQHAFIPVRELFEILKIRYDSVPGKISGFIVHPDSTYQIIPGEHRILYKGQEFDLPDNQYIQTPEELYLRSDQFGRIFHLHTDFSFRSLAVVLSTEKELPVIKQRRLERMRENLNQVKGVVRPDTLIPRSYHFFRPGFLDWGVTATQQSHMEDDNRLMLGLGTMLVGGETTLRLNYSTRIPFRSRDQFYQWRRIDNDSRFFKQLNLGRIQPRASSSLFAPVSGIQVSNSPVWMRRSFGTYTLSDYTEPRWTVELYVNNVLVDYTQADASGFFNFEVPLMYGNTLVDLRYYGPYGEERTEERMINIPYNFVPQDSFEYTWSAGIVENQEWSRFSRFDLNYGLSNAITLGGGIEYFSEVADNQFMPYIQSSVRFAPNLLFTGEYMYGVKGEALLSYRTTGNLQVDLNYTRYHEDQSAINYNYLEERKISLSSPLRFRDISLYGRFSLHQILMPTTELTTAQMLFSGVIMGIGTNFTTFGIYNDRSEDPTIYSSLSQTYRLPFRFLLSPEIQFDYHRGEFITLNLELERSLFQNGHLNVGYENNLLRNVHIFEVGLRYTFGFAQTGLNTRFGNRYSSFVESARGSLLYDANTRRFLSSSRSSLSRAALSIRPFLDLNWNGKRDPLEPGVSGLELNNQRGTLTYNEDRTVLWVTGLQPYADFLLEIDPVSLDNIAWRIPDPKLLIEPIPNHFQEILIPVQVLGEMAGMVYMKDKNGLSGQGRIIVRILDAEGQVAATLLSEPDGYFTFLGLRPGKYTARIDQEQLADLGYFAEPAHTAFEIEVSEYGDIEDDLSFTLRPVAPKIIPDTQSPMRETEETTIPKKETRLLQIDLGERGYYAFIDTDENIKIIQQVLNELGYDSGKVDGIYGKNTLRAVRQFQTDSKILLDGIFGPQTLKALQERVLEERTE